MINKRHHRRVEIWLFEIKYSDPLIAHLDWIYEQERKNKDAVSCLILSINTSHSRLQQFEHTLNVIVLTGFKDCGYL